MRIGVWGRGRVGVVVVPGVEKRIGCEILGMLFTDSIRRPAPSIRFLHHVHETALDLVVLMVDFVGLAGDGTMCDCDVEPGTGLGSFSICIREFAGEGCRIPAFSLRFCDIRTDGPRGSPDLVGKGILFDVRPAVGRSQMRRAARNASRYTRRSRNCLIMVVYRLSSEFAPAPIRSTQYERAQSALAPAPGSARRRRGRVRRRGGGPRGRSRAARRVSCGGCAPRRSSPAAG